MWDTAGFPFRMWDKYSATLPLSIIAQPLVLFSAIKVVPYQLLHVRAVLAFLFYYYYIMFLSNLHLINKVLLKYLNVASFLCLGVFNSIFRVNSYPPTIKSKWRGSLNKGGIHISGQHRQTWWRSKHGHQELLSRGYKCSQNVQLCMEVLVVEHQDQANIRSELCPIHPKMWPWKLENDRRWSFQGTSLPHKHHL